MMCDGFEIVLFGFAVGVSAVTCGLLIWLGYTMPTTPLIVQHPTYIDPDKTEDSSC